VNLSAGWDSVLRFVFGAFLDAHVFEFAGFEDFAAFQTLYELGIFIAADNLHTGVLAWLLLDVLGLRGRL